MNNLIILRINGGFMEKKFNSKAFYEMCKIREEIESKIVAMKGNKPMEDIYKNQLKIVSRCINSLYL